MINSNESGNFPFVAVFAISLNDRALSAMSKDSSVLIHNYT
jgi:hypothetical protein